MATREPRYEYRVWGNSLQNLKKKIERLANKTTEVKLSKESYLISTKTDECNAKVRAGILNLKILLATERQLELWQPVLDADFPLSRALIEKQLFPALRLDPPRLKRPQYLFDDFYREVVQPQSELKPVTTIKKRTRFHLDQCRAEFTLVTIGDITYQTVAVESTQADLVDAIVQKLELFSLPNTSYIRQLKRILAN
jgi:hypothetical protein